MKKIVIKCPKCQKKMKILDKVAKYRCPNCKEIYKYTSLKRSTNKFLGVFIGMGSTAKDIKNNIKHKYQTSKNTYNYMKNVKKNLKKDPNWSNYHKEQNQMKDANGSLFKFKNMFFKNKK